MILKREKMDVIYVEAKQFYVHFKCDYRYIIAIGNLRLYDQMIKMVIIKQEICYCIYAMVTYKHIS